LVTFSPLLNVFCLRADIPGSTGMTEVSSVFADDEQEFSGLLTDARACITDASAPSATTTAASAALDAADRSLVEAGERLQSMTLEVAGSSGGPRSRVDAARIKGATVRADLRAARVALAKRRGDEDRAALFDGANGASGGKYDVEEGGGGDTTERLLDTTRSMQEGSQRIFDSRRNIAQTESIGASILEDLQAQRNTILRARSNLSGVDEGLDQSNSILTTMNRRALMNKLIIWGIFGFICLLCLWIVYARIFG
jgi:vesicle transport through interaction with t-SNAREs 1